MEHKDEGVASIFIRNGSVDNIRLETDTDTYFADNVRQFYIPTLNRYTLTFSTPEEIIFDNPIDIHRGSPYEILIMIREKQ